MLIQDQFGIIQNSIPQFNQFFLGLYFFAVSDLICVTIKGF